ncbi:MAG: ester cyclase, partial [Chloroflexi bacterium]|nr:ester cyclase [Chloroflexota bacterium]
RRWLMTGTHMAEYAGIPATGRSVTSTGMAISRLERGRIAEEWINRDDLGLLRQLGAMG